MDTTKPLLSGNAAKVVGALGTLLAGASPLLPAVSGVSLTAPALILGFILVSLAGLASAPPAVTEGKPVLQGSALVIAGGAAGLLQQFYSVIPAGWPQSLALAVLAILAWLTGRAMPQLGSASKATVQAASEAGSQASAEVTNKAEALQEIGK